MTRQRTLTNTFFGAVLGFMSLVADDAIAFQKEVKEVTSKYLKTEQGNWHYQVRGEAKKSLLFIHGASSSSSIWKYQFDLELTGYKMIYADLLGYGKSDKPEEGLGMDAWLHGLHQMLLKEGTEEVSIVAHSNGVIVAKEFYRKHPGMVSQLVLLDGMLKPMINEGVLDWMKSALDREDYVSFMENMVKNMPLSYLSEENAEMMRQDGYHTPKHVTRVELEVVSDPATWKPFILNIPVTIVHTNNPMWDEAYLQLLETMAPGHKLLEWKDAGHALQLQYPDRLNELLRQTLGSDPGQPERLKNK